MEDDRVAILEAQLAQAKLIAEESDKKYEEVNRFNIIPLTFTPTDDLLSINEFEIITNTSSDRLIIKKISNCHLINDKCLFVNHFMLSPPQLSYRFLRLRLMLYLFVL